MRQYFTRHPSDLHAHEHLHTSLDSKYMVFLFLSTNFIISEQGNWRKRETFSKETKTKRLNHTLCHRTKLIWPLCSSSSMKNHSPLFSTSPCLVYLIQGSHHISLWLNFKPESRNFNIREIKSCIFCKDYHVNKRITQIFSKLILGLRNAVIIKFRNMTTMACGADTRFRDKGTKKQSL